MRDSTGLYFHECYVKKFPESYEEEDTHKLEPKELQAMPSS